MKSGELIQSDDFVLLPIGPKRLFIAVGDTETVTRVQAYDPALQAEAVNRYVVGRAQECVYGRSEHQLDFVRDHMGTKPEKRLFERLVEFRKRLCRVSAPEGDDPSRKGRGGLGSPPPKPVLASLAPPSPLSW
jgi:hypothetical protein